MCDSRSTHPSGSLRLVLASSAFKPCSITTRKHGSSMCGLLKGKAVEGHCEWLARVCSSRVRRGLTSRHEGEDDDAAGPDVCPRWAVWLQREHLGRHVAELPWPPGRVRVLHDRASLAVHRDAKVADLEHLLAVRRVRQQQVLQAQIHMEVPVRVQIIKP